MKTFKTQATATAAALLFATGAQAATLTATTDVFGAIADLQTVTETAEVTQNFVISDLDITFSDLSATWMGDLIISVVSPNGTTMELMCRVGNTSCGDFGSSTDMAGAYTFDDESELLLRNEANGSLLAPGTYATANSNAQGGGLLSVFNGEDAFGTWSISVTDAATQDVTSAGTATLSFTGQIAAVPLPASLPLLALGAFGLGMVRRRR